MSSLLVQPFPTIPAITPATCLEVYKITLGINFQKASIKKKNIWNESVLFNFYLSQSEDKKKMLETCRMLTRCLVTHYLAMIVVLAQWRQLEGASFSRTCLPAITHGTISCTIPARHTLK